MNNRIIVIDDEESILQDYIMILSPPKKSDIIEEKLALEAELFGETRVPREKERERYEVVSARQGEEGFEKIRLAKEKNTPFALAFIDVRMPPGWDGILTSKKIREIDPNIEIVIVTAYSDRDRREIVEKVGVPEKLLYIKKPFDPDEIRQLALSLTRKWDLESKSVKHRNYLEKLLDSVRRLKTLNMASIKEVLSAILNEVLNFVDARNGFIARLENSVVRVEITSCEFLAGEIEMFEKKITSRLSGTESITDLEDIVVFPLKDESGNLFILVTDSDVVLQKIEDKQALLKLLLESSSEALENARKQEKLIRNERIATIGQIAAGIIHEINNPLTAIISAAELLNGNHERMWNLYESLMRSLIDDSLTQEQREHIEEVLRNQPDSIRSRMEKHYSIIADGAERVHNLMGNIRNFASYGDRFEPEYADIRDALESTLALAHNSLKYGVDVSKDLRGPMLAKCDINGLKQVFLNLILNASQAMKGSGKLCISGSKTEGKILISIADNGPGISKEKMSKIFQAFYTTKGDGTGLGLSIVKGIIDKHGGEIRVDSELGEGSVFHVEIPVNCSVSE